MKARIILSLVIGFALNDPAFAQAVVPQYVGGVEGIRAATLPPPGVYVRDYTYVYWSDHLTDNNNHRVPILFSESVFANAVRCTDITSYSLGGWNYAFGGYLPIIDASLSPFGNRQSRFGIGDLFLEPFIITKHTGPFDFVGTLGVYAPTGHFSPTDSASTGSGFWTGMITTGVTFNPAIDWNFSVLNRFELPTEQDQTHIQPGNTDVLEGALAHSFFFMDPPVPMDPKDLKQLAKGMDRPLPFCILDTGIAFAYTAQVDSTTGPHIFFPGAPANPYPSAENFAAGPEILATFPKEHFLASLRWEHDWITHNGPQGETITLTLTKKF